MTDRYRGGFGEAPAAFAQRNTGQREDVREVQASVAKTHFSQQVRTVEFLEQLAGLDVSVDVAPVEMQVLGLARRHHLTVYDASYVELALRLGLPLGTLDMPLAAAARVEGVPLIGEGGD